MYGGKNRIFWVDWISGTRFQGYANLQSLVKYLQSHIWACLANSSCTANFSVVESGFV